MGILQHAAKVVRPGRIFVRQMYSVAAQVSELDHFTRLNREYAFRGVDWNGLWTGVDGYIAHVRDVHSPRVIFRLWLSLSPFLYR